MDTPFAETAYARKRAEHYLKAQPAQLGEPTILLWLTDAGLHPVTSFTRDRDLLIAAVQHHPPSLASRLARGAAAEQFVYTLSALQQAALFIRGASGKKEIVWIGSSFPSVDPTDAVDEDVLLLKDAIRSTIDTLLASRVSVYVVDPASITGGDTDYSQTGDMAASALNSPNEVPKEQDLLSSPFDMNLFAVETGGEYFKGRNDLDREIGESIQRGSQYYTLAYTAQSNPMKDGYHAIRIVMSNPDYIVHTKQGYFDDAAATVPPVQEIFQQHSTQLRADLYESLVSGMQYTGLGASVQSCQKDKGNAQTTCTVHLDTGNLTYKDQPDGSQKADFIVATGALNAKGKVLQDSARAQWLIVPAEQEKKINQGFATVLVHAVIPPGTATVRIAFRDSSGRIGTADVDPTIVPTIITPAPLRHHR